MITINFERVLVEEITVSNLALRIMPKEVLGKVNDIVTKVTNNHCRVESLSPTSAIGTMNAPYNMMIKHSNTAVTISITMDKLVTT